MHRQTDIIWMDRPRLGAGSLPGVPIPSHMSTHTYSSSPFTTSTQRDRVREVAEADLGQNGEAH